MPPGSVTASFGEPPWFPLWFVFTDFVSGPARGQYFQHDRCEPSLGHRQLFRGTVGEVDDSPLGKIPAISDANYDRALVSQVHHPYQRPERQCGMTSRHRIHVVGLAASGLAAIEDRAVPGGHAAKQGPPLGSDLSFGRQFRLCIHKCRD